MKVDIVAEWAHYQAHLLPIWLALPPDMRGDIHPLGDAQAPAPDRLALVAGWSDVQALKGYHSRMIYVEHGAGQCYAGDEKSALQPGYSGSGGTRHGGVIGFISPSETVARRWITAPSIAVGCPKLDSFRNTTPLIEKSVCIAFHWPCEISPEAGTAFHHYNESLPMVVESFQRQGFTVFGHSHPKWNGGIDDELERAGMAILATESEVFNNSSILVMDNSSLMYEFASLDRPVIALNCPQYRGHVEHGLRFWSHIPGIQVEGPIQLSMMDLNEMLLDDPGIDARRRAANHAYAFDDGSSAERAAAFIMRRITELG